ncbi:MAG TPA: preprotein translocase subunit SecG [Syntrophaceae bacterium]|nr:preprotein translocase subunit SecG [Syntrophaceae bacterium]
MITLFLIIHIFICIGLILIVLLQSGKGASMGAAFGGASQTLFGSAGPGTFLGKLTTVVAVIFMLTSLYLAYISTHRVESTVMKNVSKVEAPISQE